ncbi:hypothetical protein KP509_05G101900 [Ceratopteris richardii]|uniref:RRM domain-containing protein n=1 Tax=Ceratopteris richardii TaxID=49495 RepID=A0A8T2UPD5_CERRI|nr:hypothetical protein KP509_05G101900 [Ceratopteris richardii]
MSWRARAVWRSATRLTRGCSAESTCIGFEKTSIIGQECLSRKRAQREYTFSAEKIDQKCIKESREVARGRVIDTILSFIESYIKIHHKYPTIALVVQNTGCPKNKAMTVLREIKSNEHVHPKASSTVSSSNVQLFDDAMGSSTNFASSVEGENDLNGQAPDESGSLASIIATPKPSKDCTNGKQVSTLADILKETAKSTMNEGFLKLLVRDRKKKASNKTSRSKDLQRTASVSRRMHLSDLRGFEDHLSWEKTLSSIMPSSLQKQQKNNFNERTENLFSSSTKVERHSSSSMPKEIEEPVTCTEGQKWLKSQQNEVLAISTSVLESSTSSKQAVKLAINRKQSRTPYVVKLMAQKKSSLLNSCSQYALKAELESASDVFLDLTGAMDRFASKSTPIFMFLYFQTEKGMINALNLKTVNIQGEIFLIKSLSGNDVQGDSAQSLRAPQSLRALNVSSQANILNHSGADYFVHDFREFFSSPDWLENIISIDQCPTNVPLEELFKFFRVFGDLKISVGKSTGVGRTTVFIKYENKCDKDRVLQIHSFVVAGCNFRMKSYSTSEEVSVFLNFPDEPEPETIKDVCSKYGDISHFEIGQRVLQVCYKGSERGRIHQIADRQRAVHKTTRRICHSWKRASGMQAGKEFIWAETSPQTMV